LRFLPLLALLGLAALAAPACADSWASVFAADRDTAVFLGTDGTLFRARMNLEGREVLWPVAPGQHVVRFAVSPVGGRVAWIARGFDEDTTRLWVSGPNGAQQKLRYFSLIPALRGRQYSEPDVPSIADPQVRGGRLVQAGASMKYRSANTLAWTADGLNVVLGFDGGIVRLDPVTHVGSVAQDAVAVELEALRPSPMFLVKALTVESPEANPPQYVVFDLAHLIEKTTSYDAVRDGHMVESTPITARHLEILGPTRTGWKMRATPELEDSHTRVAGATAVWWARKNVVYALRAVDSVAVEVLRTGEDVLWLGYDEAHGRLLGAAGRELWSMPESGGVTAQVLQTTASIRSVLRSRTGASVGVFVADSLLVWNPTGTVQPFHARGYKPCTLFESPDGRIVVQIDCGRGQPRQLARADMESHQLIPVETPALREGMFHAAGHGAWILLYDPAPKPPKKLFAYDVALDQWRTVDNPGITAWEPLRDSAGPH